MLLDKILENDTRSCYAAIKGDLELAQLNKDFYAFMDKMPDADGLKLESIFSCYMARVTRIAYLQGMKDFLELHVMLKEDTVEILNNYIDGSKRQ